MKISPCRSFKSERLKRVDLHDPKNGPAHQLLEVWGNFCNFNKNEGGICFKHMKIPLIKKFTEIIDGTEIVDEIALFC